MIGVHEATEVLATGEGEVMHRQSPNSTRIRHLDLTMSDHLVRSLRDAFDAIAMFPAPSKSPRAVNRESQAVGLASVESQKKRTCTRKKVYTRKEIASMSICQV